MALTTRQIKEAFDLFDGNRSGTITQTELELALRGLGFDMPRQQVSAMMKVVDNDCKGCIDLEQFSTIVTKNMPQPGSPEEVWRAYKLFDLNQKGRIPSQDLKRVAQREDPNISDATVQKLLAECAEYPQKGISFEEWRKMMQQLQGSTALRL